MANDEEVRTRLSKFLGPTATDAAMSAKSEPTLHDAVLLVAGTAGFVSFCEERAPLDVAAWLNGLLPPIVDAIHARGGIVDKFLGDGLLAHFGAISKDDRAAENALLAARDIAARSPGVRIALHAGTVALGNIGAPSRLEFTVVGDAVNVAFRLGSAADAPIVLSDALLQRLPAPPPDAKSLGAIVLKGRKQPVTAHRIG